MTPRLPAGSRKCRETRPAWAALLKRPSGRSRLLRDDPSTISSPATTAADPDKPGRPRSDRHPHNHSPPALTSPPVQIRGASGDGTSSPPVSDVSPKLDSGYGQVSLRTRSHLRLDPSRSGH